jgi:hypothetical protein
MRKNTQGQSGGEFLPASQSNFARGRSWTAGARLEVMIARAALPDADKKAWCREHDVYPAELMQWRADATAALAQPSEARQPTSRARRRQTHPGAGAGSCGAGTTAG